jgi:glycosyltransferase involved in cell wall biosynthesis
MFPILEVVIPTRNRFEELVRLLKLLNEQKLKPVTVIIIDSSDEECRIEKVYDFHLEYRHVSIKSAAIQRNLGLKLVSPKCDYVAFLDDDVLPDEFYFGELIKTFENDTIGVSGMAVSLHDEYEPRKNRFSVNIFKRVFKLDSTVEGILLHSGVNIPIRLKKSGIHKTDWLIGCAIWKYAEIKTLGFEADFYGQSLGEDVIFSVKAAQGKFSLLVNSNVLLLHEESIKNRPNSVDFWNMWVFNRYMMIARLPKGKVSSGSFHLANFGQIIILISKCILKCDFNFYPIKGIFSGYRKILNYKGKK